MKRFIDGTFFFPKTKRNARRISNVADVVRIFPVPEFYRSDFSNALKRAKISLQAHPVPQ
jgi:hypothetical protein